MKLFYKCTAAITAILLIALVSGCARLNDGVILAGSTSVQPFAEILAEEYYLLHPEKIVDVQGGGSSAGISAAQSGTADIGMSSRRLKENESALWSVEIAKDSLAIIVHPQNPVNDLTMEQLRDIYSGKIGNWSELGGHDAKIHIIAREAGSGTRSSFTDMVMGDVRISPKALIQNSNGAIRLLVADDQNAVGFISSGILDHTVKPVSLDGVLPTGENIVSGDYKLFRPFLFVCQAEPTGETKAFIDFTLSSHGQRILAGEGLIPVAKGVIEP
ncbi:MAG: phosphate ABC transporter substrate-binding protein [Oscillospiraceae bacterium]|nr:phosphate ABC transporter substrate-binding protein [Oscillospiraceae bacterium]